MLSQALLAYIDPMAGSILLQSIVAGVFGVFFMLRRQFVRLGGYLLSRSSQPQENR